MARILIVEDEPSVSKALKERLEQEGFEVTLAQNGQEGLLRAANEKPDLILLDLIMPHMDGITMLQRLREDEWGRLAKVIVLSNLSDDSALARSMEKGVYDYLVKTDWKLEDVVTKVKERLAR
jgi:two-component system, OmpR family, phosphate regulon response regulator PhoB